MVFDNFVVWGKKILMTIINFFKNYDPWKCLFPIFSGDQKPMNSHGANPWENGNKLRSPKPNGVITSHSGDLPTGKAGSTLPKKSGL